MNSSQTQEYFQRLALAINTGREHFDSEHQHLSPNERANLWHRNLALAQKGQTIQSSPPFLQLNTSSGLGTMQRSISHPVGNKRRRLTVCRLSTCGTLDP